MAWLPLCALDDVGVGEVRTVEAEGTPMLVIRGEQGIAVIPPSCPHMANPLADGFFDGCVLTCNKHLWQWSIPDGQPMGEAEQPLLRYESEQRDGRVWVNFERPLVYEHEDC